MKKSTALPNLDPAQLPRRHRRRRPCARLFAACRTRRDRWPRRPPTSIHSLVLRSAPTGVVVTVGKADMGQHIASTMAQIIAEELGALEGHAGPARLQRSEVQRPRARRPDHRRQLEHDDELRRDVPRRRRRPDRADQSRRGNDGRAGERTGASEFRVHHAKSKKS